MGGKPVLRKAFQEHSSQFRLVFNDQYGSSVHEETWKIFFSAKSQGGESPAYSSHSSKTYASGPKNKIQLILGVIMKAEDKNCQKIN
jgi:hypothetical protein